MALATPTFNDFVTNATIIFKDSMDKVQQTALNSGAFERITIEQGSGEDREFSEIDSQMFLQITSEGEKTPEVLQQQGFNKRLTMYERKGKVSVTDTMRRRAKYRDVLNKLTDLGFMVPTTRERDLSHRFTFATETSYNASGRTIDVSAGDGLAMCYSAHLLKGTSDTYRNRVDGDPLLSESAIEKAEKIFEEEIKNQFGEKMEAKPTTLITTRDPNTCNTAREILQATAKISATNDGVPNVYEGKYRHVELPWLATDSTGKSDTTKRGYWFLINTNRPPFIYASEVESKKTAWIDEDTDTWYYKVFTSYGIAGINPRSIVGSFPTLA